MGRDSPRPLYLGHQCGILPVGSTLGWCLCGSETCVTGALGMGGADLPFCLTEVCLPIAVRRKMWR